MSREDIISRLSEARKHAVGMINLEKTVLQELDRKSPIVTVQTDDGRIEQREHYWLEGLDKLDRKPVPEIGLMTFVDMIKHGLYDRDESNMPRISCEYKTSAHSGSPYCLATISHERIIYKLCCFNHP